MQKPAMAYRVKASVEKKVLEPAYIFHVSSFMLAKDT